MRGNGGGSCHTKDSSMSMQALDSERFVQSVLDAQDISRAVRVNSKQILWKSMTAFIKSYLPLYITYIWIALQISSGVLPTFRSVMARFLALLESNSETLLRTFWIVFCLLDVTSIAGPWALVLNISSNSSTFRSWRKQEKQGMIVSSDLHIVRVHGLALFCSNTDLWILYQVLNIRSKK